MDAVGGESYGGCSNQPPRVRGKKHFVDDRMVAICPLRSQYTSSLQLLKRWGMMFKNLSSIAQVYGSSGRNIDGAKAENIRRIQRQLVLVLLSVTQ